MNNQIETDPSSPSSPPHDLEASSPLVLVPENPVELSMISPNDPEESSTVSTLVSPEISTTTTTTTTTTTANLEASSSTSSNASTLSSEEECSATSTMSTNSKDSTTSASNNNNDNVEESYPISGFESVQGRRSSMEDAHVALDDVRKDFPEITKKSSYYGVYDGHGGVEAAVMCEQILHKNILTDPTFMEGDIVSSLKNGFCSTDKQVLETAASHPWNSGSTVVVTVVQDNNLFVADVGDSEAVLANRTDKGFEAVLLSQKQKPSDPSERDRIKQAGGHVVFGRVMGSLAVSRAIGDKDFKYPYNKSEADFVSALPYVNRVELTPQNEFMIVACDGLWDKFTYQQAVDFIAQEREAGRSPTEAAKNIVKSALDRGTLDNVTTIVVYLTPHTPLPKKPEPPSKQTEACEDDDEEDDVDLLDFLKAEGEKVKAQLDNQTRHGSPKGKKYFQYFDLPPQEEILQGTHEAELAN